MGWGITFAKHLASSPIASPVRHICPTFRVVGEATGDKVVLHGKNNTRLHRRYGQVTGDYDKTAVVPTSKNR